MIEEDKNILLPSSIFQRPVSSGTSSGQTTPGRLSSSPTFKGYSFARNGLDTHPDINSHESFSASVAKAKEEDSQKEASLRDYIEEQDREQLFLEQLKSPDAISTRDRQWLSVINRLFDGSQKGVMETIQRLLETEGRTNTEHSEDQSF